VRGLEERRDLAQRVRQARRGRDGELAGSRSERDESAGGFEKQRAEGVQIHGRW
jgi:hypothetical protein